MESQDQTVPSNQPQDVPQPRLLPATAWTRVKQQQQQHLSPSPPPEEEERIARCVQALAHAARCRDANCRLLACARLKRVVLHHQACRRAPRTSCAVCRQFMALCIYHAKGCEVRKCLVPFCLKIRIRMKKLDSELRNVSSVPEATNADTVPNVEMAEEQQPDKNAETNVPERIGVFEVLPDSTTGEDRTQASKIAHSLPICGNSLCKTTIN